MKRSLTQDFKIDDTPMLTPDAGVGITCEDLEEGTERDESGFTHRSVLRCDVKTWQFSYSVLTAEEYAYTKKLLRGKNTFQFSYKDEDGQPQTVTAFCRQTSASWWSIRHGVYKNLQFDIIEC